MTYLLIQIQKRYRYKCDASCLPYVRLLSVLANARTREPLYIELQKPASVGKTDAGKEPAETLSSSSQKYK